MIKQLGIDQSRKISFAPNNIEQQIKRRYHIIEDKNDIHDDELDFDCQENNEKQLFKRISNLQQQKLTKKCK